MIDIKLIRAEPQKFIAAARDKNVQADIPALLEADAKLLAAQKELQGVRTAQNAAGKRIAKLSGQEKTDAIAEMPTLYVDPPEWRRGLGGLLCRAAMERSAQLGFRELTLWVVEINARARAFYDAFGFEPDGATQVDEDTTERLVAHRYRLTLPDAA